MTQHNDILACAQRVFDIESKAVASLKEYIDEQFVDAVQTILSCSGRVIVTGIGKSGLIGQKITATLASTGTPSFFLHPAEAIHGDLGMVTTQDVVVCLSKSGNTGEISAILPVLKKIGVKIITITGNPRSSLAERSDIVLNVYTPIEACPNDLAPTASTTAMLAMGDALAVALLEQRGFRKEDFAFLHPGGSLGRLFMKIDDIMFTGDRVPKVKRNADIQNVISEISQKRFGCACVVDEVGKLVGIITDGDIRRNWQNSKNSQAQTALDLMNDSPKVLPSGSLAPQALKLMEIHNILQVIVVNKENKPVGMVHLHDLLEAGIGRRTA